MVRRLDDLAEVLVTSQVRFRRRSTCCPWQAELGWRGKRWWAGFPVHLRDKVTWKNCRVANDIQRASRDSGCQ